MSVSRDQFVAEARTWLGTRWQHQGRLKGVGVDCVGLVLETARALGLTDAEYLDYPRRPDATLAPKCDEHMERIPPHLALPGDVLLFAWRGSPIHMAVVSGPDTIIHAFAASRAVVEHSVDAKWRAQVWAAYHMPGVA